MTTTTENQPKKIPDFYIFLQGAGGENIRTGAAFKHGKGDGLTVLIGNTRYVAFPPKSKSAATPEKGA
jgi:hypothetical protein